VWAGSGKKGAMRFEQVGQKSGQLILSMGSARVEVHIRMRRATIQSKRLFFFTFISATHAINTGRLLVMLGEQYISPLQVKNKPRDGETEHVFILGPMDCVVASNKVGLISSVSEKFGFW
jgi:hypothetical protein